MPEISLSNWNEFLADHPEAHILQSGEWGELKSAFGWDALRVIEDGLGAQILFRRLPLGLKLAGAGVAPVLVVSDGAGSDWAPARA
jgi:lipid II:glycine glycyltransferase (peptidoglycan interpeptide bridge formation enzyme)